MTIFSGIVIYMLTWWMMFFCILPLNIQNIIKPTDGTMPGAPVKPGLMEKATVTTIISFIVWLIIYFLIKSNVISFREIAQTMNR